MTCLESPIEPSAQPRVRTRRIAQHNDVRQRRVTLLEEIKNSRDGPHVLHPLDERHRIPGPDPPGCVHRVVPSGRSGRFHIVQQRGTHPPARERGTGPTRLSDLQHSGADLPQVTEKDGVLIEVRHGDVLAKGAESVHACIHVPRHRAQCIRVCRRMRQQCGIPQRGVA